jgi:4-amino-4-deoxy-L-arabinose transferase-like glycosyltransferase
VDQVAWGWIFFFAAVAFAALLLASGRYGYHRDELYFIEAGRHLAFGYPDQPLMTPLLARAMDLLAPGSLLVLRLPAALAAMGSIVSAGLIAREAGGSRRAQAIASCCCAVSAITLAASHLLTTTALDLGFTSVLLWLLVRLLRTGDERLWAVIGATVGAGLLNKLLVGILVAAVVGMMAIGGPRRPLCSRWVWLGAVLALLGALPYLLWQIAHGLPQLQVAHSQALSEEEGGRAGFIPFQLIFVGPLLLPVWLSGLVGLFRRARWRAFRSFGFAYLALAAAMLVVNGKAYYLAGFYPLLLGFGAVCTDGWLARGGVQRWSLLGGAIIVTAAISAVLGLWLLPERSLGGSIVLKLNSTSGETVGWPRFTDTVASVFHELPVALRSRTAIFTSNYGEAGAIDLFGPSRGLPQAYSGHNGFAQWGPPPNRYTSVVVVGQEASEVKNYFTGCRVRAHIDDAVGVKNDEQGAPVWFCKGERNPWSELWPSLRHYD